MHTIDFNGNLNIFKADLRQCDKSGRLAIIPRVNKGICIPCKGNWADPNKPKFGNINNKGK